MNLVLLIRHAHYDYDTGNISRLGTHQAQMLGNKLRPLTEGRRVEVYSSTIKRAFDSAQMVFEGQGARVVGQPFLCAPNDEYPDGALDFIDERITNSPADILAFVSHLPLLLAAQFAVAEKLQIPLPADVELKTGQALVFDQAKRFYYFLS